MWKRKDHREITLTPARAQQFLEINTFSGQRHVKAKHKERIKADIEAGTFLVGSIIVGVVGGKKILANGQHQCMAVIESGLSIQVQYDEYECKTMQNYMRMLTR